MANIISSVLHPFMVPVVLLLFFSTASPLWNVMPMSSKVLLWVDTLVSFVIFPVALILCLKKFGILSDYDMKNHKERIIPLILTSLSIFIGSLFLRLSAYASAYRGMYISMILLLLVFAMISIFWKISMHSMAWGVLCAYLLPFGLFSRTFFMIAILCWGMVSSSRLLLGRHDIWQVMSGFLLGFVFSLLFIFL